MKPAPVYLQPGDVVELGIDGLGQSRQDVVAHAMSRHVLAVDLKDDPTVVAAYLEHHRRVWPEVLRSLRAVGLHGMEIFLLERRLVMIVDADGDYRALFATHAASHPRVAEWEALMQSMQEPPPGRCPRRMVGADAAGLSPDLTWRISCRPGRARRRCGPSSSSGPAPSFAPRICRRTRVDAIRSRVSTTWTPRAPGRPRQPSQVATVFPTLAAAAAQPGVVFDVAVPGDQIVAILEQLPRAGGCADPETHGA